MATESSSSTELLVEGTDDYHVVFNLCKARNIPIVFAFEDPNKKHRGGFEWILEGLNLRIKQSGKETIGIIMDADENVVTRWAAIQDRLRVAGYKDIPTSPDLDGTIITAQDLPTIGVWIMPDNQLNGMLEDFVIKLIPNTDELRSQIEVHLNNIEAQGLNKYNSSLHRSKAFIHSWLACQENPGRPMGLSLTCRYLSSSEPIALKFTVWLKRLFNILDPSCVLDPSEYHIQ